MSTPVFSQSSNITETGLYSSQLSDKKITSSVSGDTLSSLNAPRRTPAIRIHNVDIQLDGRLNESIWQKAPYTGGFTQRDPNEGAPATDSTRVAFAYNQEALYIGARMYRKKVSQIRSVLSRRDSYANSARIIISLDTYLDRRTAYNFGVSAAGVRVDYYHPSDEREYDNRDYSFDPVWDVEVTQDSLGWIAEIRIPLNQLRYSDKQEQVWGLNINRFMPNKNEDAYWVHIPKNESGWASNFGLLTGIKNLENTQRVEFLPYIAGNAELNNNPESGNPFSTRAQFDARIGGNLKWGLGPNLTLDATVNPDFGQVEADPAQVNLTAFETRFEEKRPFFTEGKQLLKGEGATYFYSRRIGAPPTYEPDAPFVEEKRHTTILGAGKITGRTQNGLSIGGLSALTGNEYASVAFPDTNRRKQVKVEPLTTYNVGRIQQEFGPYASTAGVILTGMHRSMDRGTPLYNRLSETAVSGGGDWNLRFQDGKYVFSGDVGFSYISGSRQAMRRIQRSSTHYFQRPDASYLSVDTGKTSLSGYRGSFRISKRGGEHWLWSAGFFTESPGFNINDMGIMRSADRWGAGGGITYRENDPGSWYRSYRIQLGGGSLWNYGGTRKSNEIELSGQVEFHNFWRLSASLEMEPKSMDDRKTRGGPLIGDPFERVYRLEFSSDFAAATTYRFSSEIREDNVGGWTTEFQAGVQLQLGHRWEVSLNPTYIRKFDTRQYLTTLSQGPPSTFGKRYIFASINRKRISTQIRVNFALNPDLSLEWYVEPFVASGNYRDPGQLSRPGANRLDRFDTGNEKLKKNRQGEYVVEKGAGSFSFADPDFNFRSFRSNLVLRYQWAPGSTLYLVWEQNRFTDTGSDRLVKPGDLFDTLTADGFNFLAVKINYWIPSNTFQKFGKAF